jgi:hypothetical protein
LLAGLIHKEGMGRRDERPRTNGRDREPSTPNLVGAAFLIKAALEHLG